MRSWMSTLLGYFRGAPAPDLSAQLEASKEGLSSAIADSRDAAIELIRAQRRDRKKAERVIRTAEESLALLRHMK